MSNVTQVTLTAGVPTAPSGTVSTLDNLIGLAGTPNVNVQTVQGVAGATAVKVDGSAVTQPVSIATAPVLVAGSALIGKVGIDQTTDGTTNKVAADVRLAGVAADKGAGTGGSATQRVIVDSGQLGTLGQAAMASSVPVTLPLDGNGPYSATANFVSGAITSAMTGTTSTSLVAAPGASLRNYITTIIVSNSHATVGTDVIIQDGSGGTTLLTIPAAALYGGAIINLPVPLKQPTTNTALFCANVTTGASTKVSAVGYKGA